MTYALAMAGGDRVGVAVPTQAMSVDWGTSQVPEIPSMRPGSAPMQWYAPAMRATMDKAGRLVIPKPLRDQVGLVPGEVEIVADGAGLYVEPIATGELVEKDGLLVVPASGQAITDEQVQSLRDALQHRAP
jgi:AbrB family looped-hinge helix DNA binding protein